MAVECATRYKYRAYSARALEMLIKRELYFAEPTSLNDPYDCRIDIRKSLSAAIQRAKEHNNKAMRQNLELMEKMHGVFEKMDADIAGVGILSLTRDPANSLMWSHYADNHCGFCVGFQFSEKFTTHQNDEQIVAEIAVSYTNSNPFVRYFEEIAATDNPPEWEEFWTTLLSRGMLTKAKSWQYEEEVRVLRKNSGLVAFAATELSEIVFGLNMSSSNRETIRKILSGPEWEHVRYREVARSNDFELALREVN